jgi:hypothetical protein
MASEAGGTAHQKRIAIANDEGRQSTASETLDDQARQPTILVPSPFSQALGRPSLPIGIDSISNGPLAVAKRSCLVQLIPHLSQEPLGLSLGLSPPLASPSTTITLPRQLDHATQPDPSGDRCTEPSPGDRMTIRPPPSELTGQSARGRSEQPVDDVQPSGWGAGPRAAGPARNPPTTQPSPTPA